MIVRAVFLFLVVWGAMYLAYSFAGNLSRRQLMAYSKFFVRVGLTAIVAFVIITTYIQLF